MYVSRLRRCQRLALVPPVDREIYLLGQLIFIGLLFCMSSFAQAQSAFDGYTHRIRTASSIEKLGPDLFGDATNMVDGSTTFSVTDVALPTNGNVPLSVGRTFRVDAQVADQQGRTGAGGIFGPYWDLDVPYMVGTFDAQRGWVGAASQVGVNAQSDWVKRCTLGGLVPQARLA